MGALRTTLANRVRELRILRGWTQEEVARRASLEPKSIAAIERGRRGASLEVLERLAGAVGVKPAELLTANPRRLRKAGAPSEQRVLEEVLTADPSLRRAATAVLKALLREWRRSEGR